MHGGESRGGLTCPSRIDATRKSSIPKSTGRTRAMKGARFPRRTPRARTPGRIEPAIGRRRMRTSPLPWKQATSGRREARHGRRRGHDHRALRGWLPVDALGYEVMRALRSRATRRGRASRRDVCPAPSGSRSHLNRPKRRGRCRSGSPIDLEEVDVPTPRRRPRSLHLRRARVAEVVAADRSASSGFSPRRRPPCRPPGARSAHPGPPRPAGTPPR
jgi:hypothetical protein